MSSPGPPAVFRLIVWAAGASFVLGCAGKPGPPGQHTAKAAKEETPARSDVQRGPVRVVVEVEPAKARLSDEPTLTLTIDYVKGVQVDKPPFGQSLGEFVIRDFREPLPRTRGDHEILQQIYTLEPTATGKLAIAPVSVTFTDARPDGDGQRHTIETEAISVQIASVVASEVPSLSELRPAAGPVELPARPGAGAWWAVAAAAVLLAGFGGWLWWKRRRRSIDQKTLSPQELAYLELERLLEADLAARDVKRFYVELTGVVRRYIERTTGIRAPEETTEEFLREISGKSTFSPEERGRLRRFLESADLVKFAAYAPGGEDVETSFQRAKVFIGLESTGVAA